MEVSKITKIEAFLRLCAILCLVSTACLAGLDAQTKVLFYTVKKEATSKSLDVILNMVYVCSAAAGYNVIQLSRCSLSAWFKGNSKGSNKNLAWFCFLFDQLAVYVEFGANSALFQASLLGITGAKGLQWMKLCNRFTRFCFQIGGALACGYVAAILMAIISFISAFNLFRLYSPKHFMVLKAR